MSVQILTLFDIEPIVPQTAQTAKQKRVPKAEVKEADEIAPVKEIKKSKEKTPSDFPVKKIAQTNLAEKNYYSIGETAAMFKVRTSHIRFWTVQFGLKMRTTRKGDRLYTPENIEQLKVIHHLVKEKGFTIAGAKARLKELKNVNLKDLEKNDIFKALQSIKATLILLRNQI